MSELPRVRIVPAFAALAFLAVGGSGPVAAQTGPVVVELFTSQGCSSCPPAEDWLASIAGRDDVIALALHVDYWDYLGWADPFANPAFTKRQKAYARHMGEKMIYTPQVIVNGGARLEGSYTAVLDAHITTQLASQNVPGVRLTLSRTDGVLTLEASAVPPLSGPVTVQLVRYRPQAEVDILRGENAGRRAVQHNVVTDWSVIGEWSGQTDLTLTAESPGDGPVVVILQEPGPGAVVAAARLR